MKNELLKKIKAKESLGYYLYQKIGGDWLGKIRNWIKWNAWNGSDVTWGSDTFLNLKNLTVREIEQLAADIAAAALQEYADNYVSDNEVRALKIFANPENWKNENGQMIFQPNPDNFHFVHATMKIKYGYELLIEPEEFLNNIKNNIKNDTKTT